MDHYVAYMESEIRQLRLERDLLQARVAQQAAEVERLKAQVERVREVCDDTPLAWQESASDEPVGCVFVPSILAALGDPDE